jgi:hypothetical protein
LATLPQFPELFPNANLATKHQELFFSLENLFAVSGIFAKINQISFGKTCCQDQVAFSATSKPFSNIQKLSLSLSSLTLTKIGTWPVKRKMPRSMLLSKENAVKIDFFLLFFGKRKSKTMTFFLLKTG